VLPRIRPMRLRQVAKPFDDPDCIFELKHDGWRAVAYIDSGVSKLLSRNLKGLRFDSLQTALCKLPARDAILDGEIVSLDQHGVSQFNSLLSVEGRSVATFYAFDLLWLDGEDLRNQPLVERKLRLERLIRGVHRVIFAQHIEEFGIKFFEEICRSDLEGIAAKRKMSTYKDDGKGWLKIKNPAYSQAEGRHELLTRKK